MQRNKTAPKRSNNLLRWKRLLKNKAAVVGLIMLILLALVAIFAEQIAPYDPNVSNALNRLNEPSALHLFGTDNFGRDVLSRVIYGARQSLSVSAAVVCTAGTLGVILGSTAAYFSKLGNVIMRILDGFMAFPSIVLNIAIMSALGPSVKNVILALTVSYTPGMVRIVRSAFLVQKEQVYVDAARVTGNSRLGIMGHILPNCIAPIIIQATMIFGYVMLAEASLSFLGVGVPPEVPSWGNILSIGRTQIRTAPWITIFSGMVITTSVLSINMFGDGLRDALDPKLTR